MVRALLWIFRTLVLQLNIRDMNALVHIFRILKASLFEYKYIHTHNLFTYFPRTGARTAHLVLAVEIKASEADSPPPDRSFLTGPTSFHSFQLSLYSHMYSIFRVTALFWQDDAPNGLAPNDDAFRT